MDEQIILDTLTQDYVNVMKQKYITQDEVDYPIGATWSCGYSNHERGRLEVESDVPEPYKSVIMLMWGDKPTVIVEA